MTVTERTHTYPCATREETAQSLSDLQNRRDRGLVATADYYAVRTRLIRAALGQREPIASPLHAAVRAVDWQGTWADVFAPLKVRP